MKIFEILAEIQACVILPDGENAVNTETGEVIDIERLKSLEIDRDTWIKNVAMWAKQLDYDYKDLEDHEKSVRDRRRAVGNQRDRLKKLLVEVMGEGGKRKYPEIAVTIAAGKETAIFDLEGNKEAEMALPEKYQKWSYQGLSKTAMLEDLKNGVEIPGARIGRNPYALIKG